MKKSELKNIIKEEILKVLKEASFDAKSYNKIIMGAFKKMGLKVLSVDCAPGGINHGPSCEVKFKDLSYGGGDEYDIMNDYNDEYRFSSSGKEDGPEFTDVQDMGKDRLKFFFEA